MDNKVKFTIEQQEAITSRANEILVSAAAGSGKTAVLVERIIMMILEDQVAIDKLVVLTFTNAAALQMKERIRIRLQNIIPTLEGAQKEFIEQQLLRLPLATICTFHAYCIQVLRKNHQFVALNPGFKIAEENVLTLLKEEAMHQTLEEILAEENVVYTQLIHYFVTGTNLNKLEKIISDIYERTRSFAFVDDWMKQALRFVQDDEQIGVLVHAYEMQYYQEIKKWLQNLEQIAQNLIAYPKNQAMIMEIRNFLQEALVYEYESSVSYLQTLEIPKWPSIKKDDVTTESKNAYASFNKIKKDINKLLTNHYTTEDIVNQQKNCAPIVEQLLEVVKLYEANFRILKDRKDSLDFSDLEHYMIKLLINHPQVKAEIAANIVEVLVDEYQDTNEVQDTILQLLKNDHNRIFMVGDVKQSIYRFRLADPTIFLNKKKKYQEESLTKQALILLNKNFRSSGNILNTANIIFDTLFQLDIKYDESEKLYLGNIGYENDSKYYTKWHFFEGVDEVDDDTIIQTTSEKKATIIVNEIIDLVNNKQLYDESKGLYRKTSLNDIAILFRSRGSDLITYIEQKLEAAHIHYSSEIDKGYFDAVEVNVMLAMLNVLENPYNSIALLAYLRSPICAFTDEELYQITKFYETTQQDMKTKEKFYTYVQFYLENNDNNLAQKLQKTFEQIGNFKNKLAVLPLSSVIEALYDETFYYNFVAALPNGPVRQANLQILVSLAKAQEEIGKNGLYSFNKYMRNLQKNNRDFAIAKPEKDGSELLQMMTIHKSKGLEFPIVFVVDLDKKFNEQDLRASFQMSKEYGIALQYHDVDKHIRYKTWHYDFIAKQMNFDAKAEELRVLYVALTRPMQHLHLFLNESETQKSLQSAHDILTLNNFGDALRSIYYDNKLQMTTWEEEINDLSETIGLKHLHTTEESNDKKMIKIADFSNVEKKKIAQDIEWNYPLASLQNYPQKQTVTELKNRLSLLDIDESQNIRTEIIPADEIMIADTLYQEQPKFMRKQSELSPMEKGTLYHFLLQQYDWEKMPKLNDYLHELMNQKAIAPKEVAELNLERIEQTIKDIYETYLLEDYAIVARELPFSFKHAAKDIYQDNAFKEEQMLIQGKIDLLLKKNQTYLIIDFKTDKLKPHQTLATLEERYQKQLELYQEAVKKFYQTESVFTKIYAIFL